MLLWFLMLVSCLASPLLAQLVGGEVHNLSVAHHHQVAIILACALYQAALRKQYSGIYTFL